MCWPTVVNQIITLAQCWPNVVNQILTSAQCWPNVVNQILTLAQCWPSVVNEILTLAQCWPNVIQLDIQHWPNVVPTVGSNVGPMSKITLGQCHLPTLGQYNLRWWANVGPMSSCYLGICMCTVFTGSGKSVNVKRVFMDCYCFDRWCNRSR